MALYDQVMEAAAVIQARSVLKPAVGMILGSGLGDLAAEIRDATAIPYGEIPHFLRSTVVGHAGRLLLGTLEDVPVVVMQRSEEHTSELQSHSDLVCRLLLEKKK